MEEETPLERLQSLSPTSRYEVYGMLQPYVESLWEACNARITYWGGLETNMLDSKAIETATERLNARAAEVITDYLTPRQ